MSKCFISHVVYQVNCIDCNGSYSGKTKHTVLERIAQHRPCLKGTGFSCLAYRVIKTGHNINWNDVKIITLDNFDFRLIYKKKLAIKLLVPLLNTCQSSVSIDLHA